MKKVEDPARLRTLGVVADELGVAIHRVGYILHTRHHIQPVAVAGRVRLFDLETVAEIRHELNTIEARTHRSDRLHTNRAPEPKGGQL